MCFVSTTFPNAPAPPPPPPPILFNQSLSSVGKTNYIMVVKGEPKLLPTFLRRGDVINCSLHVLALYTVKRYKAPVPHGRL